MCRFLAMVKQLHHLETLIVCDAFEMVGDFGKVESHPSLLTIKLMADICTCRAFTSVLRLQQLQELCIEDLRATEDEEDVVSFSPVFSITAS